MVFTPNANLIDKRIAASSHAGTSFDPEKRADQEINEFVETVQDMYNKLKPYATSEPQRLFLDSEMARFQSNYASKYNDLLASHSRIVSPMIAGPSRFPVSTMQKRNRAFDNKLEDTTQWKAKVFNSIKSKLKDMATEEAGGEVAVLQKKIESAKELQEMMKAANKIVKKKISNEDKIKQIANLGLREETARKILIPDYMGRIGFPSFELTNNNARIRNMEERIKEMGRREATPAKDMDFDGGTVVINKEDDRVQILFDAIPSEQMRSKLKGEGWRWSPFNKAWQRKFTEQAIWSAQRITGAKPDISEVKNQVEQGKTVEVPEQILKQELKPKPEGNLGSVIGLMIEYYKQGLTYEDFLAGLKGAYLEKSGYKVPGEWRLDVAALKTDLIEAGYPNLRKLWLDQLIEYGKPKKGEKVEPLLLYPAQEYAPVLSSHITQLEKGKTIEMPASELKLLMSPEMAKATIPKRKEAKKRGVKCVPPVRIPGHCRKGCTIQVRPHTRRCPVRSR